jgi:hypothetical protein
MKKSLLLLTLVAGISSVAWAQVCTPDSAAFTAGVIVYPSSLVITPGIAFSGTTSVLVPDSLDASVYDTLLPPNTYYVYLDSIHIDSVNGTPSGIGATITPGGVWLYPGQYACLQFSGTTNATPGNYPVAAFGGACVHGNILGYALDSCSTGQLPSPAFFNFSLTVGPAPVCIPDSAQQPRAGISPSPNVIPCVVDSAPYFQTIQVRCPTVFDSVVNLGITTYPLTVTIDSMQLDSVINLPAGITWARYPARLNGGQIGCLTFSGTTTAAPGYYHLGWYGTAWVHATGVGARTVVGSLNRYSYVNYYLNVIGAAGDTCIPYNPYANTGINTLSSVLNTELDVYPNPSNGAFTLKLNAGSRVHGQVEVIDVTGRVVFSQDIDLIGQENISIDLSKCSKGIYTVLLKTANGNAARRISID